MPPRATIRARAAARHLVPVCLAALAVACGPTLDASGLEEQLSAELHDRFPDSTWQVSCPDGVEPEAGSTFTCTATDDGGDSIELEITQDDGEGRVTWRIAGVGE
jgi:hypothetical protein